MSDLGSRSALRLLCVGSLATLSALCPRIVHADEGGVSFWLPGLYGSLAAVPQQAPGWSVSNIYYHDSVSAGGDVSRAREVTLGNIPANVTATANANLHANLNLGFLIANYAFETPVLGGQASVGFLQVYGGNSTSLAGTLSGTVTGPGGGTFPFSRSDSINSSILGFGDLYPTFAIRWNAGVNNYMFYATGDIPVGAYDSTRLANLGIGHGAIDTGGGYTYFDPKAGHEFSAVLGFTYNLENTATQYQSGVDMHLDWGASQFLTKQWQVGLVGYWYQQLSCDSGLGNRLGCFESRVGGIGPQIGYIFPISKEWQGYVNLKGYGEFAAQNRAEGWNAWLTFVISPAAPGEAPPSARRMITK